MKNGLLIHLSIFTFNVLSILLIVSCAKSKERNPNEDLFEPSFKEQKKDNVFTDFFDSISYTYSNYKYNIAVQAPKTWKYDQGISEHTIFRSFVKDSGYSFSINVIETKYNVENNFWKIYYDNKKVMDKQLQKMMENQLNTKVIAETSSTSYLKNYKSLKRKYLYTLKNQDYEVEMYCIIHQVPIENFTYTISLNVPKLFYDERTKYFENLFSGIYWLTDKKKVNKEILIIN
jgi:hypothetical protein